MVTMTTDVKTQVKNGFRGTGLLLLVLGWLFLVFGGLAIVTTPPPPSRVVGWSLLLIAALIAILTMDKWVKVFPGLLAYGVFGSILMLLDGHAVNHPEIVIPWYEAVALILFFTAAAGLSFSFTNHKLTVPDRIALFVFIVCYFWQAADQRLMTITLGVGFACLAGAWAYDRFQVVRERTRRHEIA